MSSPSSSEGPAPVPPSAPVSGDAPPPPTPEGDAGLPAAHPPEGATAEGSVEAAAESATEGAAEDGAAADLEVLALAEAGPELAAEAAVAVEEVEEVEVEDTSAHRFECRSCGFVYDPAEGVRKIGIEAGTPFAALDPYTFRCPVCRSKVGAFRDIGPREKPSGFEENLNFGLGVNRLTPGQKNVLIFGGFALAFAFFLSLYSLR